MKIKSKEHYYSNFFKDKTLFKQLFIKEPDLKINNIFIFKNLIYDKEIITFKRMPKDYAILQHQNGENVESRICYSTPIKLFFMLKVENKEISAIMITKLKGIFKNYFSENNLFDKPKITSFGITNLELKKSKSNELIYFYIFNNIYFRNLKHLYKFMEELLKINEIKCNDILTFYSQIYSVPLFNKYYFVDIKEFYDFQYGMLQYFKPGSLCNVYYVE